MGTYGVRSLLVYQGRRTLYVQDLFDDGEEIPGVGKVDELKLIDVKLVEKKVVKVA